MEGDDERDLSMSGLSGHCHCGQCKYSVEHEGVFHFCCSCESCTRLSAGGRLLGISVPDETFKVEGPLKVYAYPGGSGESIELSFCSNCSSQLFARPLQHEGFVILRAGTLDKGIDFKPRKFIFVEEGYGWDLHSF